MDFDKSLTLKNSLKSLIIFCLLFINTACQKQTYKNLDSRIEGYLGQCSSGVRKKIESLSNIGEPKNIIETSCYKITGKSQKYENSIDIKDSKVKYDKTGYEINIISFKDVKYNDSLIIDKSVQ